MTSSPLTAATPSPARPDDLRARLQAGIAFNLIGAAFNQGSTFAVNVVVANLLGRERFGEYTMVQATLATLATLGQFAMGYAATKYVAEFRSRDPERTGRILGLCFTVSLSAAIAVSTALLAGASWLATEALRAPHLTGVLMIAAVAVLFTVVNGFQSGALAGLEAYPALARAGVASGSLYLFVCTAMAWGWGLNGAMGGLAVSAVGQCTILNYLLRRETARQRIVVSYRGLWREREVVLKFAVPASLSGLIHLPAVWIASAFLARQPDGYQQMALFGAASNFRTAVLFLPQTVNNVGMSLLNSQRRDSEAGYRSVFWMNFGLTVLAAIGGAAVVVAGGPWLLRVFGVGFDEGNLVLLVLMGTAVVEATSAAIYQVVQSHARIWLSLFAIAAPRDVTIVALGALLSSRNGALGLAAAHGMGWLVALSVIFVVALQLGLGAQVDRGTPPVRLAD